MNAIYLKRVAEQDIERTCEIFLDKDAWPYEESEAPDYNTLRGRVHGNLDSNSILNYLICAKNDENSVGLAFIWIPEKYQKEIEIGCTILPSHRKKGYGFMATKLLLQYGFEDMGAHRITAECNAQNTISTRILETIGFRREAVFIERLLWNGKWTDQIVYAILDREYFESIK
ncbi:MAG: GNAT family N-acetyltransferase [Oscillospiraceae bacterium]|nr:GNAT family N-acetyltransferase [Oscillospiraceae bacterium]